MADSNEDALARVYAAKTPDELNAAYADWARDYDRETLSAGYCLPFLALSWVARYVPRGQGPLLDAGCGTGLSGPYLRALGYEQVEGLDFSTDMLRLAEARQAYAALKRATLGEVLPWPDGYFDAFLSTGVFTEGHAPASSLTELCRITRPGGHAIFTVRDTVFETGGFAGVVADLTAAGTWQLLEESPLFRAFAIDEPAALVRTYVFRIG